MRIFSAERSTSQSPVSLITFPCKPHIRPRWGLCPSGTSTPFRVRVPYELISEPTIWRRNHSGTTSNRDLPYKMEELCVIVVSSMRHVCARPTTHSMVHLQFYWPFVLTELLQHTLNIHVYAHAFNYFFTESLWMASWHSAEGSCNCSNSLLKWNDGDLGSSSDTPTTSFATLCRHLSACWAQA